MTEAEKIEAFFAVDRDGFTPFEGFSVQKTHPLSPLRVIFDRVSEKLLSYLDNEAKRDPCLRVLTLSPLPLGREERIYTLYRADRVILPDRRGRMLRASEEHREAVGALIGTMLRDTEGVCLPDDIAIDLGESYLWENDSLTALARVAFRGKRYARLNTVVTAPDKRGCGYAGMLVGSLASALLAEGLVPTVLADRDNPVSNRLYTRLGFEGIGSLYEYRFGSADTPRESALTCGALPHKR